MRLPGFLSGLTTSNAPVTVSKAPKTASPYQLAIQNRLFAGTPRRGARVLRELAQQCEFVRTAINRRKAQISQADWHIIRTDSVDADPDPKVVKAFNDLIRSVNPTGLSFNKFLDILIEDILVLDAGVFEKERTRGGQLIAMWPVDAATIQIDPAWRGEKNKARFSQVVDYQTVAQLTNDQMTYIMQYPRSYDQYGLSPVEMLVKVIESELYTSNYERTQLEQAAPNGLLFLGEGTNPDEVDAFKTTWEDTIAGAATMAILGGGAEPKFMAFNPHSNADQQLLDYHKWLALKVASVFMCDPQIFGITDNINKANGQVLQTMTDEGHVALATTLAEYITRELLWEIDPNHKFEFKDLNRRDELAQAKIDQIYMGIGVETPNAILKRMGRAPVEWGDQPYAFNVGVAPENTNSESEPPTPQEGA